MRNPGHGKVARRAVIASAAAAAVVVAGGGYALASTNSKAPTPGNGVSLTYLVGPGVTVAPHGTGQNAAKCPAGMYPIAGGPTSSHAQWEIQSSVADSSNEKALHPNEWTVGLLNNSDSRASFKVFVVCGTANSVNGNT